MTADPHSAAVPTGTVSFYDGGSVIALGGLDQWPDSITALSKAVSLDKQGETNAKKI